MKIKRLKAKAIHKMLTLLGFSSVAFVFSACYGTIPYDFDEDYQDSLSVAFSRAQTDSIEITQPATSSDTPEHNQSRNVAEEQHHQ